MTLAASEAPARIARMHAQNVAPRPRICYAMGRPGLLPIPETLT